MGKWKVKVTQEEMNLAIRVGNRLREFRTALGLSQRKIYYYLEMSPSTYSDIENGVVLTDIGNIFLITNYMGITLKDFYDFDKSVETVLQSRFYNVK